MNFRTILGAPNAGEARGLAVAIDVFRAFTTACYAVRAGLEKIIPVETVEEAFKLQKQHPAYLLMGERHGEKLPGFDFGNSPAEFLDVDLFGKTAVHTTSLGTLGLMKSVHAESVITGSFVNADAIVRYIRRKNPPLVSFVCTGSFKTDVTEEDELCAQYVQSRLEGKEPDIHEIMENIRELVSGQQFFDPLKTSHPEIDFPLCMDFNRFDFVLELNRDEQPPRLVTVEADA